MAIKKRKGSPYYQITFMFQGRQIRRSTGTSDKRKAEELEAKLKADLWRQSRLREKPRKTWRETREEWVKIKSHGLSLKTLEGWQTHLKWLNPRLDDVYLDEIDLDLIEGLRSERLQSVSSTSVNRTMECVRALLNMAKEREWISTFPKVPMFMEEKRVRWITREEAQVLIHELPEHLSQMMRFTLATGLREQNVVGLEWSEVAFEKRMVIIPKEKVKTKQDLGIPLSNDAVVVLRECQGIHPRWVFSYNGDRVMKANTAAWRKALKRAGISNFRWHDLRHTWASWHVQSGTPLHVLKELGGWSSMDMVLRYGHLDTDHLAEFVNNSSSLEIVSTKFGTLDIKAS